MSFWESVLGGGAGAYGYKELMDRMQEQRGEVMGSIDGITQQVQNQGGFTPWGVRAGGLGSGAYDPATGQMDYNLNDAQQSDQGAYRSGARDMYRQAGSTNYDMTQGRNQLQNAYQRNPWQGQANQAFRRGATNTFGGQAQNLMNRASGNNQMQNMGMNMSQRAMQDTAGRETDVYNRIRDMQRPDEERQRDQMTSNLFGSGRGGMGSGAYGASPEEHGFNMARNEAMNQASLQAMGQAQAEQAQQASIGGNMFGQGMGERQMYEKMGQGRYGMGQADQNRYNALGQAQYGMGQADQNMLGKLGLAQMGQGMNERTLQGNLGQAMFNNQFGGMNQLQSLMGQGIQGQQLQSQADQNMAQMMAELGLGGIGTELNYSNLENTAFGQMIGAGAGMLGGVGGAIDEEGGLMALLSKFGIG
jgi:hypothetical protein